jgi:hypothetical protein
MPAEIPQSEKTWETLSADADQGFEIQRCKETGEHRHRSIDAWGAMGAWEPGVPPTKPPPKLKPKLRRPLRP